MPTPMRNGPASQARFCTVIVTSRPHSDRRCGGQQLAEQPSRAGPQEDARRRPTAPRGPPSRRRASSRGRPGAIRRGTAASARSTHLRQLAVLREQVAVRGHVGEQVAVPADRGDPAVGEQRDPVGQQHRRGPVGHDQRRRPGEHVAQRPLDQRLGVHVEGRQRVVEDQHGRPAEDGAGEREPLPLPAGQRQPLLADAGGQAPGQVVHELGLRDPQRLLDVGVGGVGAAEREVLAHAHREQRRVLEGGGDDAAQLASAAGRGRRRRRG